MRFEHDGTSLLHCKELLSRNEEGNAPRHASCPPSTQCVLEKSYPLPSRPRPSASVSPSVRRPTYPLCELGVHHEVVDVFFGPRELQLSRDHGNEERRTAGALKREGKRRLL